MDSLRVTTLSLGPLQANCFIVARASDCLVIDPGDEAHLVVDRLERDGTLPAALLLTHGHFDHFGGVAELARRYDVPVYLGHDDLDQLRDGGLGHEAGFPPDPVGDVELLSGEQVLALPLPVRALPTPGHSRGSYSFGIDGHLFSGDLLFRGSVGRTDFLGGDMDQLLASVALLMRSFPPATIVHCGHGPDTTLARELASNPFLTALRGADLPR
ncbi:MAG: MBL fold metallo-hydrolase [Thermoleophilia bacterium]